MIICGVFCMRDPERIEAFCKIFADVWSSVPDWRFGQLVYNMFERNPALPDLFYLEDDRALKAMEEYYEGALREQCREDARDSNCIR